MYYELSPAYGRDYKTAKEVKAAFEAGKDFVGDYNLRFALCSIRDFKPGDTVNLRYKKNRSVVPYKVTAKTATA
jgi:hypothetical protein